MDFFLQEVVDEYFGINVDWLSFRKEATPDNIQTDTISDKH